MSVKAVLPTAARGALKLPAVARVALLALLAVALSKCWLLTQGFGADGRLTYIWACWQYDEGSRFDNTWPTWATDYFLAGLTGAQALRIRRLGRSELCSRASLLLLMYSASTLVGGLTHQLHDGTPQNLNTGAFRAAWTLVVGLTAAAGGAFGLIGVELLRLGFGGRTLDAGRQWLWSRRRRCPHRGARHAKAVAAPVAPERSLPDLLTDATWLGWIVALSAAVVVGVFSCTRPACDVFIAGCSQALPTIYLQLVLLQLRGGLLSAGLRPAAWVLMQVGLVGNVPLIFVYPWLVQRSGLGLGAINALLHTVLAFSWGLQGLGLEQICALADARSASFTGRAA